MTAAPATASVATATDSLTVLENGRPIAFTVADLTKYHGYGYPGGVAHAFKVMQRAFPLLDGGRAPERAELALETRFPGPGGRDAFEMVTRVVTGGRFTLEERPADPDPVADWMGKYLFRWRYRGTVVEVTIKPGHVREEFIRLAGAPDRTPAEEERLAALKTEMADRLMALPAEEIYEARVA